VNSETKRGYQVKAVLQATADELQKLKMMTTALQDGATLVQQAHTDDANIVTLQSLDYMLQSMVALTSVLNEVAQYTPGDWALKDLREISQVKLKGLQSRLLGLEDAATDRTAEIGDYELFT
jgi:hypothetical protein